MAGKGGGAWKVAYADFVTAMMAFFMVMWLVGQSKPVKEAVAGYFRDPSGRTILPGNATSLIPLKDGGPSVLGKGGSKPMMTRATGDVIGQAGDESDSKRPVASRINVNTGDNSTVGTQVPFDDESADIDTRGKKALDQLLPSLLGKLCKIEIRGHASGKKMSPESKYADAWELSYARSMATMKYLTEKGVEPRCIRLSQSGSNEPNLLANTAAERVQNARVEIYVLNEFVTDPSELRPRTKEKMKRPVPKRMPKPKIPGSEEETS